MNDKIASAAARAAQEKHLRDAAMEELKARYGEEANLPFDAPNLIETLPDKGPSVFRRLRADALAPLHVLANAHSMGGKGGIEANNAEAAVAWAVDAVRLQQAIELVEEVYLR